MTNPQNFQSFGTWLKSRRKRLDLTQAELGKRAGCSAAAVRKLEADERKPSRELAESLARVLQISGTDRETFLQFARGIIPEDLPPEEYEARQTHASNLPTLLTSTVNRTNDLAEVTSLLRQENVHLVTLIGPPGIGKTRLSIHCGNDLLPDFPDGIWFVDLAEIDQGSLFAPTVVRSLDFLEQPPNPGINQLINGLKHRKVLLILDNFEQIVNQAANEAALLLKNCSHLKLLVTSRIPLHIYGEHEHSLPPLSIPPWGSEKDPASLMNYEAVQLFVSRIRQHQPKFASTPQTSGPIVEICHVLDGIPLALELVAASLRRMTLEEMVSLLKGFRGENWVRELSTPARDLPQRQRTLENVVAWSYTLLSPSQQDLFCKLGLFSGWFDDEAVASICFDTPAPTRTTVHDLLGELSDYSLLVRDFINGIPCWRMLELIHEYAVLQLGSEVRASLRPSFTRYFLEKLKVVNVSSDSKEKDSFYYFNVGNLHAALKWAIAERDTESGFSLSAQLGDLWMSHGYSKEGLELLKQLFALPDSSPPGIRIRRLQDAADLAWQKYDFETSLAFSRESGELAKANGIKSDYLWFLNRQGRIYIEQGHYNEARQALEECLQLVRVEPELMNIGSPLAQLGELALFEGNLDEAKSRFIEALGYLNLPQFKEDIFLSMSRVDLAEIALAEKDFDQAYLWLAEAQQASGVNIRRLQAYLCALAGYLILPPKRQKKDMAIAAQMYGAIESLSDQSGIMLGSFYQKKKLERITLARKRLSAGEWELAFQDGLNMTRDEAITLSKNRIDENH